MTAHVQAHKLNKVLDPECDKFFSQFLAWNKVFADTLTWRLYHYRHWKDSLFFLPWRGWRYRWSHSSYLGMGYLFTRIHNSGLSGWGTVAGGHQHNASYYQVHLTSLCQCQHSCLATWCTRDVCNWRYKYLSTFLPIFHMKVLLFRKLGLCDNNTCDKWC